eukprot:749499-Hanusia_phi.AAC.5
MKSLARHLGMKERKEQTNFAQWSSIILNNSNTYEESPDMPNSHLCIKEDTLDMCVGQVWKERRVALTSQFIAFTFPRGEKQADNIPLHEIAQVSRCKAEDLPQDDEIHQRREIEYYDTNSRKIKRSLSMPSNEHLLRSEFKVSTIQDGFNSGRSYVLRASTEADCEDWIVLITNAMMAAKAKWVKANKFVRMKNQTSRIYKSSEFQMTMIVVIVTNFAFTVTELQILAEPGTKT